MGRRSWTTSEDEMIRSLYPTISNKWLAKKLNRKEQSVRQRACDLGIKKRTQDELEFDDVDNVKDYIARKEYIEAHINEQTTYLARKLKVDPTTVQRIKKQITSPPPPRNLDEEHLCFTCKYATNGYYDVNGNPVRRDENTMYRKGYCCWADEVIKYPDGTVTEQRGYLNLKERFPRLFVKQCQLYELG